MKTGQIQRTLLTRFTASACFLLATGSALLLTGCGMASLPATTTATPVTGSPLVVSGKVMGGQQPVAGVALNLYAAGTGGYGSAATALFAPGTITTTALGNFNVPTYSCPAGNPDIFMVGTGGTPIGGTHNNNLALMVGLGPCQSINQNAFINVNEITTVATVWALSGFMSGPTNIGAPASNKAGLDRAFAAINKLVTTTNGLTSGPALPPNATLPVSEINALGNILQNCVNSGGSTGAVTDGLTTGTPCDKLFYLATPQGGTAPTDTITAAMNVAQHPSLPATSTPSYVSKLNSLQSSSPAFAPALSVNTPPTDWTIAINYTGAGVSSPKQLAIDASGNVWVTSTSARGVAKLDNTGAGAAAAVPGYTASNPVGVAIDQAGFAWVAAANGSLAKVDPTGASSTTITGNGLGAAAGVAIDGAGNVWVTSGAGTLSGFTNTGAPLGVSPVSAGGLSSPSGIAINPK